jgi:hypothetical protein
VEEEKVEEEGERWSEEEPDGDSLEADLAEVLEELGGAGFKFGEEERDGERVVGLMEEGFSGAIEGDEEGELEWVSEVIGELNDGLIEAEEEGGRGAEEGGGAEDGEDAEGEAEGDSEGDFFWRDALLELGHDGVENAAFPERGGRRWLG